MKLKINERKFYINLALFFLVGIFWTILDAIFNETTDLTNLLVIGFFVVWNVNQCAIKE